jgi:hypothetical protein
MPEWSSVFERVIPYVVKIETPDGFGTGFLFSYNADKSLVAFATAAHVIERADTWKLPIKLRHHVSGKELFVRDEERIVDLDNARDSASILIATPGDHLPDTPLPMMDSTHFRPIGSELAWAGYPGIAPPHLCLFTGTVAAFDVSDDSYLIDGVAINGVSGGPVFSSLPDGTPQLLGSVSAYMMNRQRGESLPGLLRAQDITPFQKTVGRIRSLDEAREKAAREAEERHKKEAAAAVDPGAENVVPTASRRAEA